MNWEQLGVQLISNAALAVVVLFAMRYLFPILIDANLTAFNQANATFERTVSRIADTADRVMDDCRKQRELHQQEMESLRAELREQRQHDTAMQDSSWRHIRTQGERFEELLQWLRDRE